MHIMKYYVKRCVGLPGDTFLIRNGMYEIKGINHPLGNRESQQKMALRQKESFEEGVYRAFPFDSVMGWSIKDFGPFYIPRKGDGIALNRTNCLLYKKLIEWEQKATLEYRDSVVYLDRQPVYTYIFQANYYFVAGDRVEDSKDSRYWGLLPETYIVGKAWLVWKSTDPYSGKFRRERFMKKII
jgi:signal peptidase I